jgi:hypothetical protein
MMRILTFLLLLFGFSGNVFAESGPCGVLEGRWATPSCAAPDFVLKLGRRTLAHFESDCSIRSAKLSGQTCTLRLACETEGEATLREDAFRIIDDQTIHYQGPDLDYRYCGVAE